MRNGNKAIRRILREALASIKDIPEILDGNSQYGKGIQLQHDDLMLLGAIRHAADPTAWEY